MPRQTPILARQVLDAVVLQVAQCCEQRVRGHGVQQALAEGVHFGVVAVEDHVSSMTLTSGRG
jgi:hypothetical protein